MGVQGVQDASHQLEPSIEREAATKSMEWGALETLVISEFQARAATHLPMPVAPTDDLAWLAMMQHYSVPTRLLDFTYSPYVALYFAVRKHRQNNRGQLLRLYAINESALNDRFLQVTSKAARQNGASDDSSRKRIVSLDPAEFATPRDSMNSEADAFYQSVNETLTATGKRRAFFNKNGCVCAVAPRSFNPRLASQQGLFLLNGAEQLKLKESLRKMMQGKRDWLRAADIRADLAADIESKLFQMNIHDQSLFPDLEGLAGLVRQKIRLHWR